MTDSANLDLGRSTPDGSTSPLRPQAAARRSCTFRVVGAWSCDTPGGRESAPPI